MFNLRICYILFYIYELRIVGIELYFLFMIVLCLVSCQDYMKLAINQKIKIYRAGYKNIST